MPHAFFSDTHIADQSAARTDRWLGFLSKVLDSTAIIGGLVASVLIYRPGWAAKYTLAALIAAMVFVLLSEIAGIYRPWRGESVHRQFFRILFVWSETVLALLLLAYALKTSASFSRISVTAWLLGTPFLLSGWRILARLVFARLLQRDSLKRKVVVWGASELGDQLVNRIRQSPWLGLTLIEYVKDTEADCPPETPITDRGTGLTEVERLELLAKQGKFDILYIALPITARTRIVDLIEHLADSTVSVYMVPDFFTTSLFHGTWANLEGIPIISVFDTPFWGADGWLKRAQDILLSSLFLLLAAVPMALIAAGIKLTSPGPVLFKQRRYGIDGNEFGVWKFRSMCVCQDEEKVPQAQRNDPRVTGFGAFLRRTSLDELPQFINVLMGDMSIVGPRPHAVAHNELYRKQVRGYMLRHKVRPGITGWAQINGWRGETDSLEKMQTRVEHDLWYIRNWSMWLDLKIILLTAVHGFTGKNAY